MYTPVTPTLLPSSMFSVWLVSAPGTIKNLVPSPALKPILAPAPHWMSPYMKNTNVICWSAAITTWNVFACNNNLLSHKHQLLQHTGNETFTNYYHSTLMILPYTSQWVATVTSCAWMYTWDPPPRLCHSVPCGNKQCGWSEAVRGWKQLLQLITSFLEKGGIRCLPEEYVSNVHIVPERSNQ